MRVLITCARTPIAIEWVKVFKKIGAKIILTDSLKYPIASFESGITYIKIASPKLEFEKYKKDMQKLIEDSDLLIPNCEDIFYLAKLRDEQDFKASFFMPDSSLLFSLHNKYEFFKHINSYVKKPKTELIYNKNSIKISKDTILKPIYSRFGNDVIRDITKERIESIECSEKYPWVQQQKIEGKAICNYAVIENGEVISHTAYEPKYLLNNSAATYFTPYSDSRLDNFIKKFAKDTNYTGQVAFDFIDNGKDLFVLECNPRGTSGLHIISKNLNYKNGNFSANSDATDKSYRVGNTLFTLFGTQALRSGNFKKLIYDYKNAKNVLESIPFYAQSLFLLELVLLAKKEKKSLTQISTYDIEYNGWITQKDY